MGGRKSILRTKLLLIPAVVIIGVMIFLLAPVFLFEPSKPPSPPTQEPKVELEFSVKPEIRHNLAQAPSNQFAFVSPVNVICNNGLKDSYNLKLTWRCYNENGNLVMAGDGDSYDGWYALVRDDLENEVLRANWCWYPIPVGFTSAAGYEWYYDRSQRGWDWEGVSTPITFTCKVDVDDEDNNKVNGEYKVHIV